MANHGINPKTGAHILEKKYVLYILQHMRDHGLYESSDKFFKEVKGFPAKSGVGGVILLVIPGIAGIGIISPPLDKHGNSVKGQKTAKEIVETIWN
jgi:glutaminase